MKSKGGSHNPTFICMWHVGIEYVMRDWNLQYRAFGQGDTGQGDQN